jgi:hypothetical protein
VRGTGRPGVTLHALARHWELTHDVAFAERSVDLASALVPALRRVDDAADRAHGHAALPGVAALLDAAGELRAAADVRLVAAEPSGPAAMAGTELADLLSSAGSTWTWPGIDAGHDPVANARLVTLVRDLLLSETDDGVALLPVVPDTWLGQGVEVHDAPTRHGRLSFAVRWHGDRPALLWHLEPHPSLDAVRISVPGLDPAWSTTEAKGEALLGPVALPEKGPRKGLSMPVHIEPMPGRRP